MATRINTNSRVLSDGGADFNFQTLAVDIGARFIHLLEGVTIIIVGIFAIRIIRKYIQRIQVTHDTQRMALNLLEKLTSGFLIVVTATLALKVIGLDLTLLISALMLGLSFGLKDIIKNYVSGILILFKSPFAIGDVVKIKSFTGKVEHIDFQSTTLKTFDKKEITIYNKDILSQSIVNYSKDQLRRVEISVTLGRGTDVPRALSIFEAILNSHEKVLKSPRFTIVFKSFSPDGMKVILRFWVQRPVNILKVRSEIALQIEQSFDEALIFSPYARSVEFGQDISMTEARKQRLQLFYNQPLLAAIATQTNGQLSTVLASANEQELADIEEPELDDVT